MDYWRMLGSIKVYQGVLGFIRDQEGQGLGIRDQEYQGLGIRTIKVYLGLFRTITGYWVYQGLYVLLGTIQGLFGCFRVYQGLLRVLGVLRLLYTSMGIRGYQGVLQFVRDQVLWRIWDCQGLGIRGQGLGIRSIRVYYGLLGLLRCIQDYYGLLENVREY